MNKEYFIKHEFIPILKTIDTETKPVFGKMNLHQMIEHLSDAFKQANGTKVHPPLNNEENTQKMYQFMMSDKPFKDNTPNPYLDAEPSSIKFQNIQDSFYELETQVTLFLDTFHAQKDLRIINPFFGNLNFDEWKHLLHKHILHHFRQFSIQF